MAYMKPHEYLYLQGDIDERYFLKPEERAQGKTAPYAFKIRNVMLLGNVAESFIKGIAVDIDTSQLSPAFRKDLGRALKDFPGKIPFAIRLHDGPTGYNLDFHSKKYMVNVTSEFVQRARYLGMNYSLKKKAA